MLQRLNEIEADLLMRRSRAAAEGWLGEIEGIDMTIEFLRGKRREAERTTTLLNFPAIRKNNNLLE
jgi:hypothetical protein